MEEASGEGYGSLSDLGNVLTLSAILRMDPNSGTIEEDSRPARLIPSKRILLLSRITIKWPRPDLNRHVLYETPGSEGDCRVLG